MADFEFNSTDDTARAHLEGLERDALIEIILAQCEAISELRMTVAAFEATVKEQLGRIEELEARLKINSTNSHRPPSSDPPGTDKGFRNGHLPEEGPRRRRGGQPGHKGSSRKMVPLEEVDEVVECIPDACETCGHSLKGERDSDPERRQVTELPVVRATTTEYRIHTVGCPCCGTQNKGRVPVGTPTGSFGPRLQAMVGLLSGVYRLSHRCIEQLIADCFRARVALGSVPNLERRVSDAIAAPVNEAAKHVQQQPVKHADETGWRELSKRSWLWLAATPLVAVFLIRPSRATAVARELLGALEHWILVSDRWSAYRWIPLCFRQLCWAHLRRDFKKLVDSGDASTHRIGTSLLEQTKALFKLWGRVRDGTLKRSSFRTLVSPIRVEIRRLLEDGSTVAPKRLAGMCAEILKVEKAMWTFVRVENLSPTNNHAERQIRHAVMWRKTSYGTQSVEGSLFVGRILTAVTTLRLQGRDVLEYLTAACTAAIFQQQAPSLLPLPSIRLPLAQAA